MKFIKYDNKIINVEFLKSVSLEGDELYFDLLNCVDDSLVHNFYLNANESKSKLEIHNLIFRSFSFFLETNEVLFDIDRIIHVNKYKQKE